MSSPPAPHARTGLTRLPNAWRAWRAAVLLGLATIGSYGVATYSIGVLLAPIADDTGWSTGTVSAAYALGVLGSGAVAILAGRALDRVGSRTMFLSTLASGAVLLLIASTLTNPPGFVLAWAAGSAVIGGGWYYQATMPAAARIYPGQRAAALSVLTLLGALASPIFYPLAGFLTDALGWRDAVRVLVALLLLLALPAAVLVDSPPAAGSSSHLGLVAGVRAATARPAVWRAMLAIALTAGATNALILHQVGAMEATGLSLAAASGYGGARGLMQIPARLVLYPLVRRLGVPGSIGLAYGALAVSALTLLAGLVVGSLVVFALVFAVTAGFAVGLLSPLHGLLAVEVYGEGQLGTLSGVQQLLAAMAGATAPWLAGLVIDVGGGYRLALLAIALVELAAIGTFLWQRSSSADEVAPGAVPPEARVSAEHRIRPGTHHS